MVQPRPLFRAPPSLFLSSSSSRFFLPFSFPPLFSFFLSASFSSASPPGETIRLVESAEESVLASGPSSFATWSLNGWKSDGAHFGCRLSLSNVWFYCLI